MVRRFLIACNLLWPLAVPSSLHAQSPLHGRWAAVFQILDNGEDNTLHLELQQSGDRLQGHFSTIGYGGDLSGTLHDGKFTLFAPWDTNKPFCAAQIYKEADLQAVYQRMGEALQASGRPIVYSLCEYGTNHVEDWGAEVGANLWRTTGDIRDEWISMEQDGFSQDHLTFAAGPGRWNDPDMLEVGNGKMTFDEYMVHMSLWSLLASPLIAGNDLSRMTPQTKELLINQAVIAIDQDPLGSQAKEVAKVAGLYVMKRPLADGTFAIGFLNRTSDAISAQVSGAEIHMPREFSAIDVWTGKSLDFAGSTVLAVPAHGVLLLRSARPHSS